MMSFVPVSSSSTPPAGFVLAIFMTSSVAKTNSAIAIPS
jgi:hypothetical protein